jgi:hypothetical protein
MRERMVKDIERVLALSRENEGLTTPRIDDRNRERVIVRTPEQGDLESVALAIRQLAYVSRHWWPPLGAVSWPKL